MLAQSSQAPDRRTAPRYELMAQVRVKRGNADYVLSVLNISRSGALLDSSGIDRPRWVKVGSKVRATLFLDSDLETVELTGTIVRVVEERDELRFAIEYDPLDKETHAALDDIFERAGVEKAGPPPLPRAV